MPGKFYQDDIQILYGSFQKLGDRPKYHNPYVGDPQNVLLILAKLATGRGFAQPENAEIYSKSQTVVTCCKKCHFSTFRAVFSLVDFSGKMSKRFTFRNNFHFLTFWAVFSLFDFSAKNQTVKLFAKSDSFQLFEQFWQERRKTKAVFRRGALSSTLLKGISLRPTSFPRTGSAWACVLEQVDAKETNPKP